MPNESEIVVFEFDFKGTAVLPLLCASSRSGDSQEFAKKVVINTAIE